MCCSNIPFPVSRKARRETVVPAGPIPAHPAAGAIAGRRLLNNYISWFVGAKGMKKRIALAVRLMIAALALAAAILAISGSRHEEQPPKNPVILGFSQLGSESGWRIGNSQDILHAAERAGVQLMFENAEQKQQNQIKAIRSFIAYRVDVIAFAPIVEDGWTNVLNEAREAGIPVLCTDRFISQKDAGLIVGA
jgi:simple sugar transport system substrate-binding protein